jgi:phosphate transport system protein
MSEGTPKERKGFISSPPGLYNEERAEGDEMIRHIDSELQALKDLALQMGGCVETALDHACKTIVNRDSKAFAEVNQNESRINDLQILIDESCVGVLAKQAPVARDLRLVIAITKINTDLERMGDQCVNIALAAREMYKAWPSVVPPVEIKRMIEEVRGMVRSVLDAFARRDVELSQRVLELDDNVDELKDQLVQIQKEQMKKNPEQVEICLGFIMIAKNLERLADHATNIAEEVIYLTTGADVRHGHIHSANS